MKSNRNVIARLMIAELPGLAGALAPSGRAAQIIADLARRQHRQNQANAVLAAASGRPASGMNRYPVEPLQRLGAGLAAALPIGNRVAGQAGLLERPGTIRGTKPAGPAPVAPEVEAEDSPDSRRRVATAPRRVAGHTKGAAHKGVARRPTLRKFKGTLGRRLEHPAVLPGGWALYGFEKQSGNPVYVGPGGSCGFTPELRRGVCEVLADEGERLSWSAALTSPLPSPR
jgi:hypothetical protein